MEEGLASSVMLGQLTCFLLKKKKSTLYTKHMSFMAKDLNVKKEKK